MHSVQSDRMGKLMHLAVDLTDDQEGLRIG